VKFGTRKAPARAYSEIGNRIRDVGHDDDEGHKADDS
jgi:hypothetical protein